MKTTDTVFLSMGQNRVLYSISSYDSGSSIAWKTELSSFPSLKEELAKRELSFHVNHRSSLKSYDGVL